MAQVDKLYELQRAQGIAALNCKLKNFVGHASWRVHL